VLNVVEEGDFGGTSTSGLEVLVGKSILTGSSSINCDTGGGSSSGESVVSADSFRAASSSCLDAEISIEHA